MSTTTTRTGRILALARERRRVEFAQQAEVRFCLTRAWVVCTIGTTELPNARGRATGEVSTVELMCERAAPQSYRFRFRRSLQCTPTVTQIGPFMAVTHSVQCGWSF